MEDLLCFGCSANEGKYRTDDGKIKICSNFAKKIWKATTDEDLKKPSTRFDGCGLLAEEGNNFEEYANEFGYIIPSKKFKSFEDFINALKIPYYDDYEVEVVDGDKDTCFDGMSFLKISKFEIIILFFEIFILL